jgi:UDP-N-acetyl-D-glucosamine dehydrogenase
VVNLQEEGGWVNMDSIELSEETVRKQDCVVLLTDHDCFDYITIAKHAKLIVDTRNKFNVEEPNVFPA